MSMAKSPATFIILAGLALGGITPAGAGENTTVEIVGQDMVGTTVFIRGKEAGAVTEQFGGLGHFTTGIQPGRSLVEIKRNGKTVWSREIEVEKGSDYYIEASLEAVPPDTAGAAMPELTVSGTAPAEAAAPDAGEISWRYDLAEAFKLAAQEKKPVMVDFYGPWNTWCKKLNNEVYPDPEVKKLAARFIAVRINTDHSRKEAARYKVGNPPAVVFLNSSGAELTRISGYQTREVFCRTMNQVLSGNAGTAAAVAAAPHAAANPGDSGTVLKNKLGTAKNKVFSVIDHWAK